MDRIADRQQHPGPGIRCLLEGTFNVEQAAEFRARSQSRRPVVGDRIGHRVTWGWRQMAARFLRGMVLPTEWEGKDFTGTWLADKGSPPPGNWKLYVDRVIMV